MLDFDEADCAATLAAVRAAGGSAVAAAPDVSEEASVVQGIGRVVGALGPPTVLVNIAGFAEVAGLVDMATAQWDAVLWPYQPEVTPV